jgi:hypothetical protein
MGIQIYIKKASLKNKGIPFTDSSCVEGWACDCGWVAEGHCHECGTEGWVHIADYTDIDGLPLLMHSMGETYWHDANHWGSSRKPIMEFIEKHGLTEEDWYEG